MTADLTIGKPSRVLWRFCLPMFASIVFQQLYNIADSLVAGRFIGENALAAVGNSYEITLIYLAFSFGCNVACSILVSFYFGAKELKNVHTTVSTTAIASGILCLLLVIFGFFSGSFLLQVIRTPESIFADSLLYLRIYIIGFPFVMFYNIATGIFSGLGDSRTPFLFLAFSSTANIIMDVIFVTVFSMGVAGVAWATLICQGISCILALGVIYIRLKKMGRKEGAPLFSFAILKRLAGVAIPSTLQQSFISVGNIIIQGVINGFGPAVIGLFRLGKAEQSGDHLFHDPWQRCVQLHLAEYRCRKDRPCAKGLSRRCRHCVADLHSAGGAVFLPGGSFDPILYERAHPGSHAHWHSVFAHSFALLFCDLRQAGGRRHSEGQSENELVYDRYLL